ncbi:MAG: prolipoprotein diacylglyceryl transferase [Ruminococcaceae bacterium]|nr:prolipoprotein diacylglyceryl transferase [Oscillospiraceae bacterium]
MYDNYTVISFPGLGIEIDPIRQIEIGSLTIHLYGIIIAFGLMLAILYAWKRCKQFGIRQDDITDGVLWVAPFAVLCARLYYCAFEWDQYKDNPISVLYIWEGGLAIYGGVIGALIGVVVYCRIKKIKIAALLDMVALGFMIGQAIGRWGNFFNREAFGSETESFLRMGLWNVRTGEFIYYHPAFLYESVWNAIGFAALHFLSKKRQYDGQIALGYVFWYGLGRVFIEGIRMDSLWWGPVRVSQILAGVSCIAAMIVLFIQLRRKHTPEQLFVNQVAARAQQPIEEPAEEQTEEETAEEA